MAVIEISFLSAELALAALWLLLRVTVWLRQRRVDWKREAALLLMYGNLAVLMRITFFPALCIDGRVQPLLLDLSKLLPPKINAVPIVRMPFYSDKTEMLLNHIGNIAIFIPSGFILPILYRRLNTFRKVLLTGAGLSLCIELLQLPFFERTSDIDDLILNTLGVAVGYWLYSQIENQRTKAR